MTFIQSLIDYKKNNVADFDTPKSNKATSGYIVKQLLLPQLNEIKKNYAKFVKFIDLLNHYVNATVPKINSKAMIQSFVRNLVKEVYGEDSKQYRYLKVGFSMTTSEKISRNDEAQDKVRTNNENQIIITTQQVKDFKNKILSLLNPKFKIIPALILTQLCSGCRLIEILNSDFKFEESETKENYIIQSDVAKNRTNEERPVVKPIIFMQSSVFLKLLKKVRNNLTHKDTDTNVELTNRFNKRINAVIKKVAIELNISGITSSHDLRKIYGNYSHLRHSPNNCSLQCWLSSVLGHDSLGSASANYSTLRIID
jgi:integrase